MTCVHANSMTYFLEKNTVERFSLRNHLSKHHLLKTLINHSIKCSACIFTWLILHPQSPVNLLNKIYCIWLSTHCAHARSSELQYHSTSGKQDNLPYDYVLSTKTEGPILKHIHTFFIMLFALSYSKMQSTIYPLMTGLWLLQKYLLCIFYNQSFLKTFILQKCNC